MDWQQRIQEAQRYVDQTYSSYHQAQQQSQQAMNAYNQAFSNNPGYQTIYDKYKKEFTESAELTKDKSAYEKAKGLLDSIKTQINNLSTTISQRFGGTGLTQQQRDKYKEQQYNQLNQMFTQYGADYQVKFENYQDKVDKAFSQALDVANKQYDSYWDNARRKFSVWQQALQNENQWKDFASSADVQLFMLQNQYASWKIQQDYMQMVRESEERLNQLAEVSRQRQWDIEKSYADAKVANAQALASRAEAYNRDRTALDNGQLSYDEYYRRVASGAYKGVI